MLCKSIERLFCFTLLSTVIVMGWLKGILLYLIHLIFPSLNKQRWLAYFYRFYKLGRSVYLVECDEYENCETKEDSIAARAYKQHPPASKNESQFKKPGFTLTIFMDKNFKMDTIPALDSLNNFNDSIILPW